MAKSGQVEFWELLFWTGISEILAKTLGGDGDSDKYRGGGGEGG